MLIDSHTHVFPKEYKKSHESLLNIDITYADLFYKGPPPANTEALIDSMDLNNIIKSVILGMGWTDQELAFDINNYLIESANSYPNRLIPFCSVNPAWGNLAIYELQRCESLGVAGIGELHPDTQNFDITSYSVMKDIMEFCAQKNWPILVHCSEPIGHTYSGKGETHPHKVIQFIQNFPQNIIICAHFGGGLPFYSLMPEVKSDLTNVYFDSAAAPYLYSPSIYGHMESLLGSNHILFGSDYPVVPHARALQHIEEARLDSDNMMDITYNNILDILFK